MNAIEWTKKVTKQLLMINSPDQKTIFSSVQALKDFPNCGSVKALKNHEYSYRLRVGRYRVFFEFTREIKIIRIEEVKKRDEHTY